ncbi:MAG: M55 family metallopeptidase, partial [Bryobacteraceae bacterium]
ARANVRGGVMAHSYNSLGVQKMVMNGKPVGEIETRTALAGWYGVPVVMLSGDRAAAEDLKAIVPAAEMAVVKEGIGYYACLSMSAVEARETIRKAAQKGLQRLAEIPAYKLAGPVVFEVEYTTRSGLGIDAGLSPGAEIIDARTMRYRGKDFLEAWQRFRK